jgi:hypothetical protein
VTSHFLGTPAFPVRNSYTEQMVLTSGVRDTLEFKKCLPSKTEVVDAHVALVGRS